MTSRTIPPPPPDAPPPARAHPATIGRIVHYVLTSGGSRPALVVGAARAPTVNLLVFFDVDDIGDDAVRDGGDADRLDGSDGAAVFDGSATPAGTTKAGSVYTLVRDVFYSSVTVNAGVTVVTAGRRLFCDRQAPAFVRLEGVPHDPSGAPGSWHWPPRV